MTRADATDELPPRGYCVGGCGRNIVEADDPGAWLVTEDRTTHHRVRCPACQGNP